MDNSRSRGTLAHFFSGLTEYVFQTRLGVADPPLVDYIADMLSRFVHNDAIYSVRNPTGRRLEDVAEMLSEAQARLGDSRRAVHRHIGDFTLFWSGVYPEALRQHERRRKADCLLDYRAQGKRAYYIASTIESGDQQPQCEVLERLSHDFELCAYGLGELRREWEQRHTGDGDRPPGPLLID